MKREMGEYLVPWTRRAPVWPLDEGVRETPGRWDREPDPWERDHQGPDDTAVLEDLILTLGNLPGAAGVLARYAALRLTLRAAAGLDRGPVLEEARLDAARYIALPGAAGEAERRALGTAIRLASAHPPPEIVDALIAATLAAARRGHDAGARALGRAAYGLALERDWPAQAARAAHAMADMAREDGSPRAHRRWRRRAAVLECRAQDPDAER